jgi:ribonucleoside-diphosphate reductase alpha chain
VCSVDSDETEKDVANKITMWTEMGCGVGVNLSKWINNYSIKNPSAFKLILDSIGQSQQKLWERGIKRTATMVNIDFPVDEISIQSLRISETDYLKHLNIAVNITDDEMEKCQILGSVENKKILDLCKSIWSCGNPGILFIDRINFDHPFNLERLETCNPCAEQFLMPNEVCCLGSISVDKFIKENRFCENEFKVCVRESVRFLDTVIDSSEFPSVESSKISKNRRRIGLGIMGLASMLDKLEIEYSSNENILLSQYLSKLLKNESIEASRNLSLEYCNFPDIHFSTLRERRNSYLNSIAPTGAISMIFNVSNGIDPIYANTIIKDNTKIVLRNNANLQLETTLDIEYQKQIDVLSIWQENIDGGISKTIIVKEDTSIHDIYEVIIYSWKKKCKGISVFRQNSRDNAFKISHI